MTIISNAQAHVPVVIVDQNRLTDESALQELCETIVEQAELAGRRNVVLDFFVWQSSARFEAVTKFADPQGHLDDGLEESTQTRCTIGIQNLGNEDGIQDCFRSKR